MSRNDNGNCFQFYEYDVLNQQVGKIFAHDRTLVVHRSRFLLQNRRAILAKFNRERILTDLLKKSEPECIVHSVKGLNYLARNVCMV